VAEAMKLWVWVPAARGWLPIASAHRLRSCRRTTFLAGVTSWTLRQNNEQRDDYRRDNRRGQRAAQG
jgi:alpha-beta hydrolase superfamily lysophospholipase